MVPSDTVMLFVSDFVVASGTVATCFAFVFAPWSVHRHSIWVTRLVWGFSSVGSHRGTVFWPFRVVFGQLDREFLNVYQTSFFINVKTLF